MSSWHIQVDGWWWLAVVMGVGVLVVGAMHIRRSLAKRRAWIVELCRLLIVILALVTLLRPERVRDLEREQKPQVVVLADRTGSMATADMEGGSSRQAWVENRLADQVFAPLGTRYDLNVVWFPGDEQDGTDLHKPLSDVFLHYPHLKAVVLMSDGAWNEGASPLSLVSQFGLRDIPVYTVALGRRQFVPDMALDRVQVPAFCLLDEQVSIPFRAVNHLPREVRTEVVLTMDGQRLATKPVVLAPGATIMDVILWPAQSLGEYELELTLPVEADEEVLSNNSQRFRIAVRQERLKVLVVESRPRWEYRFLRNALSRDPGVDVDCLLLHPGLKHGDGKDYIAAFPSTPDLLGRYDVIFLGDVGDGEDGISVDMQKLIRGVVEQLGSGLVLLPGPLGRQLSLANGPLADLLPVTMDNSQPAGTGLPQESHLQLTTRGEDHLLTMLTTSASANRRLWRELPGFFWWAPVVRARPGAEVLAVHAGRSNQWGRLPLLATRPFGQGNVLFMGTDSAWRWRKGVEDIYHYRFWGQVVRWMAHPRHLAQREGIRLVFSPEAPRQGESVLLHAMVTDTDGFPLAKGPVRVDVEHPNGLKEQLELGMVPGGWGVFEGRFLPESAGVYALRVHATGPGRELTTSLDVSSFSKERMGDPANHEVLRELARSTGGELVEPANLGQVVESIRLLPDDEARLIRYALWTQVWWAGLIIGLLGLFWIMRKYLGFQ